MKKPSTPKQGGYAGGKASWYNYYAGYSSGFVADVIRELSLPDGSRLLDPWNGAGTTTQVADELGLESVGYDINPVMVVIAKARLLAASQVHPSEESICRSIVAGADPSDRQSSDTADPLSLWLTSGSVSTLRGIERRIRELLVPNSAGPLLAKGSSFEFSNLSCLAAFFYVALFRVVRNVLLPFQTSNPTWMKHPQSSDDRLTVSHKALVQAYTAEVVAMAASNLGVVACATPADVARAQISVANSTALPERDDSVSAVISSPPYCTRIDYAVATRSELAVLGIGADRLRDLRNLMIGSATIPAFVPTAGDDWGRTCNRFLAKVARHNSKGSRSYYWKTHLLYFDGIQRSLDEINRVLQPGADCVLVVQDSYYKEVHNDLPRVIEEMSDNLGWLRNGRHDYDARTLMARVNPGIKTYRTKPRAVESVLHFTTAK